MPPERRLARSQPGAESWVPRSTDIDALHDAARSCRGCDLYAAATQVVFGEGDPDAALVLVGEQPGDVEDQRGRPFVGPAGRILDRALQELEVNREQVYLTNAVKHFSFTREGKRRIHRAPSVGQIVACRPWLNAELAALTPEVLVCLGASAVRSVLGAGKVGELRGKLLPPVLGARHVVVTPHPSAVLRAADREKAFQEFRDDLAVAVAAVV